MLQGSAIIWVRDVNNRAFWVWFFLPNKKQFRTRIKGNTLEQGRVGRPSSDTPRSPADSLRSAGNPTLRRDHCSMRPFCFLVNVNQLAQETGGACVLVDRGLKYTGIY